MADRRSQLVEVFEDTQDFYGCHPRLVEAVAGSKAGTKFYGEEDYPELPETSKAGTVLVSKSKSFEAAMRLHSERPGAKIAVLNFASATNPGGGVKSGSSAQEESLCRCSTLYPTLTQRWLWSKYYAVNRQHRNALHTDACIYSPGVVICKTDEDIPKRLAEKDFVTVDIITCAAPNLRSHPSNAYNPESGRAVEISDEGLLALHTKRAKHILHVAAANRVDCLVLGAFGCGAFQNDPKIVAKATASALQEYKHCFELVEFAIYCRDWETENYVAFKAAMSALD